MHSEKIVSVTQEVRLPLETVWQRLSSISPSTTFHCSSLPCSITILEHTFLNHGPLKVFISFHESQRKIKLQYFYTKIDFHRKILSLSSNGKRIIVALASTNKSSTTITLSHEIPAHSCYEREMLFTNKIIQTIAKSIEDQELSLLYK